MNDDQGIGMSDHPFPFGGVQDPALHLQFHGTGTARTTTAVYIPTYHVIMIPLHPHNMFSIGAQAWTGVEITSLDLEKKTMKNLKAKS